MEREAPLPQPGRPVSLGAENDLADAAAVLQVLVAVADALTRHKPSQPNHVAREALWSLWELPRLPKPLLASKYPQPYPWSPAAREVLAATGGKRPNGGFGLTLEHLVPRNLLIAELVPIATELDPAALLAILQSALTAAVVTKDDDRILGSAGFAKALPDDADHLTDPWCRYRAAGIDVASFAPLTTA